MDKELPEQTAQAWRDSEFWDKEHKQALGCQGHVIGIGAVKGDAKAVEDDA